MKKLLIMAVAAMTVAPALAQNPEALKLAKKAKTAAEVKEILATSESSMSAAENAQVYNRLVDFAMKDVDTGISNIQANALKEQMGQEVTEPVDMPAFYEALIMAVDNALTCDKYDAQPNDKGKVAPKFRKANGDRLFNLRAYLVNSGQDALDAQDNKKAAECFGLYVTTGTSDLFKEQMEAAAKASEKGIGDEYLTDVARFAAFTSFEAGDADKAMEYAAVMMKDPDPEKVRIGLNLQVYFIDKSSTTHEDSIQALKKIEEVYAQHQEDAFVFSTLASWYSNLGQNDKQTELINARLQAYPNDFSAWALKGQGEMNDQKYDDAINSLKKALDCEAEDQGQKALVNTFIGNCYMQKVTVLDDYDEQIALLKNAIVYLENASQLDPNSERCNWSYALYNCYYNVYGEEDAKTKDLKDKFGY